jgi:hypothetical protein
MVTRNKTNLAPKPPKRKRGNPNMQKGVYPPQLVGKGFDAHPENINKYGIPSDVVTLKKMIQEMGNETIVVGTIGEGKLKTDIRLTRFERILFDWFESQSFDKQQAIMQYGLGKVPDKVELTGKDGKPLVQPEAMKPSEIAERVTALLKQGKQDANNS